MHLGPIYWLLDICWLSGDQQRQALLDKLAGTYVVRLHAEPAGAGTFTLQQCFICGYALLLRTVQADTPAA